MQDQNKSVFIMKNMLILILLVDTVLVPLGITQNDHWTIFPQRQIGLSGLVGSSLMILWVFLQPGSEKSINEETRTRVSELVEIAVIMQVFQFIFWSVVWINT